MKGANSLLCRKKWNSKSSAEKILHGREKKKSINIASLPHKAGGTGGTCTFHSGSESWTHKAKGDTRRTIAGWIWRQKLMKTGRWRKETCTKYPLSEEAPETSRKSTRLGVKTPCACLQSAHLEQVPSVPPSMNQGSRVSSFHTQLPMLFLFKIQIDFNTSKKKLKLSPSFSGLRIKISHSKTFVLQLLKAIYRRRNGKVFAEQSNDALPLRKDKTQLLSPPTQVANLAPDGAKTAMLHTLTQWVLL